MVDGSWLAGHYSDPPIEGSVIGMAELTIRSRDEPNCMI
jgi:hypothetical protein